MLKKIIMFKYTNNKFFTKAAAAFLSVLLLLQTAAPIYALESGSQDETLDISSVSADTENITESKHIHTDSCYDCVLTCDLEESEPIEPLEEHTHTEDCYETLETLVCNLEEKDGHTHNDSCYNETDELICGEDESEGHTHTDECYETNEILVCDLAENEPTGGHVHTEECYEWQLVCGIGYNSNSKETDEHEPDTQHDQPKYEPSVINPVDEKLPKPQEKDPAEDKTQSLTYEGDYYTITLDDANAVLPDNASLIAEPVEVDTDGLNILMAFDIAIFYEENGEQFVFEPENNVITVTIESPDIPEDSSIYYIPENGEPEQINIIETEDGSISFEAEHFSVYAVASTDTVIDSGTIANGEGIEDAITWTIYENDAGERYLLIEGEGSIPDYSSENAGQPWYSYRSTISTLILGEGITRVGKQAFHGNYFSEIVFSNTVTSIGQYAFSYSQKLTSVVIPGTITTVEQYAFAYSYNLYDVTLENGVETLGNNAFGGNCGSNVDCSDVWITIPESLTSIGQYPFAMVAGYIVEDGNTTFSADENGVLYSYDGTTLIDYPKRRVANSWTIPESVTAVKQGALQNVKNTDEIYVLHQVTLPEQAFRDSNYSYVYIADDVSIPTSAGLLFYNNLYLTAVHLPENTTLRINSQYFNSDAQLASLKIPQGTTQINKLALSGTTNLETLYYDAAHITVIDSQTFGSSTMPLFDLTIGTNVDYLIANFSYILDHATSLTIEGPNSFYVEGGAFDNASAPYTGLSGWIYVTDEGVIYTLNTDTNEATLYYVPDCVTELTIPAAISTTLDGNVEYDFTVSTVKKDVTKDAANLISVTFEDSSKITTLETYSLANAPISSITDIATNTTATTVDGATALFYNATVGYNAFFGTSLEGSVQATEFSASMDGNAIITVNQMTIGVISGNTTDWVSTDKNDETIGGYTSLTGDMVQFSISVSDTSGSSQTYHVYVQVTDDDCSLNYTAGNIYTVNNVEITATATDDPYTICLEFTVLEGQTIDFFINAIYNTPTSDGGGVTIWGSYVETNQSGEEIETYTDCDIDAYWTTLRDTYTLDKTNNNQNSVSIATDDTGMIRPSAELKWKLTLTSNGDQSAYGEDYATAVTYTDTLTLPSGMEWDADVLAAIKAGTVSVRNNTLYVGTTKIAALSLTSTSGLSLSGVSINYDDSTETVTLYWKIRNTGTANLNTNTINLTIYPEALTVDIDEYDTDITNAIINTANASVNYTYSSADEKQASVSKTLTGGKGTVKLSKSGTDVTYFGEDLTYTLKVYNDGGLTYTDSQTYTLTDALTDSFYISADNMEIMFAEAAEANSSLVITISNANLADGTLVTDTIGTTDSAKINTGNSDLTESTGNELVVTFDSTTQQYTIIVNGSNENIQTGTSLETLLQNLGYGVTSTVTYTCVWTLPMTTTTVDDGNGNNIESTVFTLESGETYICSIYATVKNTFQKLDNSDWPNQYPKTSPLTLSNSAKLSSADNKTSVTAKASSDTVICEAIIDKSVSLNGENLGSAPKAKNGDVLDYTLTFTHLGNGSYDDLPMVDDLYGSQYLLVPINLNSNNDSIANNIWSAKEAGQTWSGIGVTTYDEDGDGTADYYILGIGTYTDVVIGEDADDNQLTAASVTVTAGENESAEIGDNSNTWSGVHSQIKWYFEELDGGDYTIQVSYKALVETTGNEASYTIGNVVCMNDRTGSRLYASLWGGGTIIGFDKDIVVDAGTSGDDNNDGLDDDKYTSVNEGETVTYRLKLESTGDSGTFVLTGANIADQLPNTYGVFSWSKENVNITKVEVDTSAGGSVSNETSLADTNNWSISETYNGISGTGIYFIVWNDDVTVTFSQDAVVYIYVELTYPSNITITTDENGDEIGTWNAYADEANGNTLYNTFYVYRNPINVTHVLAREGEVVLQKGVFALARSTTSQGTNSSGGTYYATGIDRSNYNNQDSNYRYAIYYVSLYNDASTKLYLNNLYDCLPEGFTYATLINNYTFGAHYTNIHKITTLSSSNNLNSWLIEIDSCTTYMSAGVSATVNSDGILVFTISAGSGTYAIKYDEDMGQFYLDKGEAIVFGYICQIGLSSETEDTATNTIAMPYTDYTSAGVVVADKSFEARNFSPYGNSDNDGTCEVKANDTISNDYGFDANTEDGSWLVSNVTLVRGSIKPGVDKDTVSYQTSTSSNPITYTNSVAAKDIVNWEVKLINGGTMSITDYTVTDIMPYPYIFTGTVSFAVYDSSDILQSSGTLFTLNTSPNTLAELSVLNETSLPTLSVTSGSSSTALTINTDGTVYNINAKVGNYTVDFTLCFYFDSDGNLTMEIGMKDSVLAIPEGGYITLSYSSWNPTTLQADTSYINQVILTPTQAFTSSDIQSGSAVTDEYENVVGISSISPVTVSSGFATNAYKSVTEKSNGNTANSSDESNSIVLSSADSIFTYTLYVENVNEVALSKLVLIDNLPYVGDTYTFNDDVERGSEFTVLLENSNFTITVTDESGNETVLSEGYAIEYSSSTSEFSEDDRSGDSSPTWSALTSTTDLSTVKSIRVIITAEIPAKSTVAVSFDAIVYDSENILPSSIAWNNFGYRYLIANLNIELEAIPLAVGVQVPSAPKLVKTLTDLAGNSYTADTNTSFFFVIYEGTEIKDKNELSYSSSTELISALSASNINYKIVNLTVNAGSSTSEQVSLSGSDWSDWTWIDGNTYTITELQENDSYVFSNWVTAENGNTVLAENSTYSFVYNRENTLYLSCNNVNQLWGLTITKVSSYSETDSNGTTTYKYLSGAVFAIYTQNEDKAMSDASYDLLSPQPDRTLAISNGADTETWYLLGVQSSDNNGNLTWTGLSQDSYYVVEIEAPSGYVLDATPLKIEKSELSNSVTITWENSPQFCLPTAGGKGTGSYVLLGSLLCISGYILLLEESWKQRKKLR